MGLNYTKWRAQVEALRRQWNTMWRERIDDKERAEGITNKEYPQLFVEQGRVIIATRDYRPPEFEEIVERHRPGEAKSQGLPPHLARGGYGKFIRDVIVKQRRHGLADRRLKGRRREVKGQPLKHGGRGWLHAAR